MTGRRTALLLSGMLGAIACWQLGDAGFLWAKAELGQILLARAWERTLAGEEKARPWGWADTWPVARLEPASTGEEPDDLDRPIKHPANGTVHGGIAADLSKDREI